MLTRNSRNEYVAPSDHPGMAAHFPGRPIVPAVTILQAVIELAEDEDLRVAGLRRVRFTRVLDADTPFTVRFDRGRERVRFAVHGPDECRIAHGELTLEPD